MVSGEKPMDTTIVSYVSTGGMAMPPLVVKAVKTKSEWCKAEQTGYMIHESQSGYINTELFQEDGEQFIQFLKRRFL